MFNVYQTATSKTLLWIALVVAAPVSEEIFFRGFLFYGIQNTRLGSKGAIILSSLIWAPLHMQYDSYNLAAIMVLGLLLGVCPVERELGLHPYCHACTHEFHRGHGSDAADRPHLSRLLTEPFVALERWVCFIGLLLICQDQAFRTQDGQTILHPGRLSQFPPLDGRDRR